MTESSHPTPQDVRRRAEFGNRLHEVQSRLFGYLHSLVRDLNDADDLFQQVSIILWKKYEQFDGQRSFLAWACGIARLEVSNFLRTRARSRLYFSDELNLMLIDAQAEIEDGEFDARREALGGCVQKLRDRDQELLIACYGKQDGVAERAQQSQRAPQSIYNSLRRIRRSLFECIQQTLAQQTHPEALE